MTGFKCARDKRAPVAPCMGCPDRTAECHGVCREYKEYERQRAEWYELKKAEYEDGSRRRR